MELIIAVFVIATIWGAICYAIANPKGQGQLGFLLGFFLGPLGVVFAVFLSDSVERFICLRCRKGVDEEAKICPFCLQDFRTKKEKTQTRQKRKKRQEIREEPILVPVGAVIDIVKVKCPVCDCEIWLDRDSIGSEVRCDECKRGFELTRPLGDD